MKSEFQEIKDLIQETQIGLRAEIAKSNQDLLKIIVHGQSLNDQRYFELKSSIEGLSERMATMATKDDLNRVFESLTQDIVSLSKDHQKLKKEVHQLKKAIVH